MNQPQKCSIINNKTAKYEILEWFFFLMICGVSQKKKNTMVQCVLNKYNIRFSFKKRSD